MSREYLFTKRYDWNDVSPTVGVVQAVSEASDEDPNSLPPLSETIDPDSLNDLCTDGSSDQPITVSFVHEGYDVTVRSDGFVAVDTV